MMNRAQWYSSVSEFRPRQRPRLRGRQRLIWWLTRISLVLGGFAWAIILWAACVVM